MYRRNTGQEKPALPDLNLPRRLAAPLLALAALAVAAPAPADPPPWAPAHGWRKQHDPEYAGYCGRQWDRDYRQDGRPCRDFALQTTGGGRAQTVNRSACSAGQGEWRMR